MKIMKDVYHTWGDTIEASHNAIIAVFNSPSGRFLMWSNAVRYGDSTIITPSEEVVTLANSPLLNLSGVSVAVDKLGGGVGGCDSTGFGKGESTFSVALFCKLGGGVG